MAVRKFWLINGNGQKFDLTDFKDGFLNNPAGLGFTATVTLTRLGNAQKLNSITDDLNNISGELLLKNNDDNALAYDAYTEFIKFASVLPLFLH